MREVDLMIWEYLRDEISFFMNRCVDRDDGVNNFY